MPAARIIPAGMVFGELTVIRDRQPGEKRTLVKCSCGVEKEVWTTGLVAPSAKRTTTCGSGVHQIGSSNRNYRHGHSKAGSPTSTYMIWAEMIQRCTNEQHPRWSDYGARGITVDARWRKFTAFLADMGEKPSDRSLDRIDNDGSYGPGNCRWATLSEQAQNRRPPTVPRSRDEHGRYTS